MQIGRPSRFWMAIIAVAMLLLGVILVVVIMLSTRLRQAERESGLQPATTVAALPAHAPAGPQPIRPLATTHHAQQSDARLDRSREKPARVVERPVKVIEREVKVVEKQVKVIERPVKVVQKPAKVTRQPTRAPILPGEQEERSQVPTSPSTDRDPAASTFQESGLPNQLTYAGKVWNASEVVKDVSDDTLTADSRKVGGHTIYHNLDADAPYPCVYLKVAGETDQFVRYVPTTS